MSRYCATFAFAIFLCSLPLPALSSPATPPDPAPEAASAPAHPASDASSSSLPLALSEEPAEEQVEVLQGIVKEMQYCGGTGGRSESWSHRAANSVLQVAQGSFLARIALASAAALVGRAAGNSADGPAAERVVCVTLHLTERDENVVVKTTEPVTKQLPIRRGQTYSVRLRGGEASVSAFEASP